MWFKNIRPYRLSERLGINAEELEQRLKSRPFTPCRPAQPKSTGWVGALGDEASALVHAAGPFWMVRLKQEEKLLPSTVVREEVANRVAQIQVAEGRKVYRKERLGIQDEVTQDFLPRAFSRSSSIEALINEREGWIWVNTASATRAEDLLALLREAIGGLPVTLPTTHKSPARVMSEWILHQDLPEGLQVGFDADLAEPTEDGGVVRVRGVDLETDEVRSHIESGKLVERLALSWDVRLDFVLGQDLVWRRLKFSDALREANDELKDDELARRDADFLLMSEALMELTPLLLSAFGGLEQ